MQDFETWKKYLKWESENGDANSLRYLFQKALISQCNQSDLWMRYFDLWDKEELIQFLQKRRKFFFVLGYWTIYLKSLDG